MTEYWWRSWHGAPTDNKYLVIAAKSKVKAGIVSAVIWALLDYASQHQDRGTVTGFDVETYSTFTGFSEDEVNAVIKALTDKKMIVDGRLANWEKRQPKSEAAIQRALKSKLLNEEVAESCGKLLWAAESCLDTDIDTDIEKKEQERADKPPKSSKIPVVIPEKINTPDFQETWKRWLVFRKEIKHPITESTAKAQLKMLSAHTPQVATAMLENSITNGWRGIFELKNNGHSIPTIAPAPPQRTRDKPTGGYEILPDEYKDWNEFDRAKEKVQAQMRAQHGQTG